MMSDTSSLDQVLETLSHAKETDHARVFKRAIQLITQAILDDCIEEAERGLRRLIHPQLDYTSAQTVMRVYRQFRGKIKENRTPIPVSVLSSSTAFQVVQLMDLFLFSAGVPVSVYEADYGVFRQEILDPASALYEHECKALFLLTSYRDLGNLPLPGDTHETAQERVQAELREWHSLWKVVHERLGCQIIQNNFEHPPHRCFANHELRHPGSLGYFIHHMNSAFYENAPAHVTIHDLDHLSALAGRWSWGDERFYHHAKMPCAPEYLVDYAHSLASLLLAQLGHAKKCLVLDLDNTLWGGVIGDDGLEGIRLGQGDAEPEAFVAFQQYVKRLQDRGVILAVCSKNDEKNALEPFEKHHEMVLRRRDISCFVANWDDKATNLRWIAQNLNIGLNSLVFVDDNPAERALVRQLAPEVTVPELPEDPSGYIHAIEQHRYFQVLSIADEDFKRTEYYRGNAERREAEAGASNVEDFLASLQMAGRIEPITPSSLERSTQLVNRSNQFNLTTRRYSSAELKSICEQSDWITRTVSLKDRFGDNGLISVLLARVDDGVMILDTWLMSCRVLKRGVEDYLLNHLVLTAREQGVTAIRGEYIPTEKNGLVRDHYEKLGFTRIREVNGRSLWELPVISSWQPRPTSIKDA